MHLHSAADFIDIVLPEHCPSTSGDTCLKHADCVVQSNTELAFWCPLRQANSSIDNTMHVQCSSSQDVEIAPIPNMYSEMRRPMQRYYLLLRKCSGLAAL